MIELHLRAPQSRVEPLGDALLELGALAVTVEDADADTPDEVPHYGEPGLPVPPPAWQRSLLKVLFADEAAATDALTLLLAGEDGTDVHPLGLQAVPDEDWVRLTQSQFEPVPITPEFWIVPSWHAVPEAARTVIRLDPGLAFGTGTHPTTRMCLRWLAAQAPAQAAAWQRVLDYGCGSGILAIGAALHGARDVVGVDIDAAAFTATAHNAQANGVAVRCGEPALAGEPVGAYPLVLANILATPLKLLAPLLAGHVAPGGHLVLAGILQRQADELRAAYAPWLALEVTDAEDGWILMTARRAPAAP